MNAKTDPLLIAAIEAAINRHGSQREAGRQLGINHVYLSRLRTGAKSEPSDDVLVKLGLRRTVIRTVTYARINRRKQP